ncbi:hypothetical protein OHB41_51760 [Streptomyces sp. NBC_01571]|uniref:hypothetical protein n=1 Tax=Streptomyces sp. NBC_01571 TaxID=2975883 RepID=UPI002251A468|nr:hypothetical protein [Streptomyces sp. NBC_01571]MCX4581437.1 hypothetical protein [Streptomyces sp. NBC_01571]
MAASEPHYTITFTDSTREDGVAEGIDVRGKYLKFREHGLWLTGCWELTVFKNDGDESRSFQVGAAFFPWHRIAEVSEVYETADDLEEWAETNGLNFEEIQRAEKGFSFSNGG